MSIQSPSSFLSDVGIPELNNKEQLIDILKIYGEHVRKITLMWAAEKANLKGHLHYDPNEEKSWANTLIVTCQHEGHNNGKDYIWSVNKKSILDGEINDDLKIK